MKLGRQLRRILLIALAIGIVILLLVPQITLHAGAGLFFLCLMPLFLFSSLEPSKALQVLPTQDAHPSSAPPVLATLFQRPPPIRLA